jgi:hypothetical protein
MDPFLEDPRGWESLHTRLIAVMSELLSPLVRPDFYVEVETTVYLVRPDDIARRQIKPDLYLVRHSPGEAPIAPAGVITVPTLVEPLYPAELRQHYLDVRNARNHAVVTTVDLLSPSNKAARTTTRAAFVDKRDRLLAAPVNWLEIDLLRAGERPPEVAGRSDYYALLKRPGATRPYEVWYADVRDRLPVVAVPLAEPYPDVPLDLQAALTLVYDRHFYSRSHRLC